MNLGQQESRSWRVRGLSDLCQWKLMRRCEIGEEFFRFISLGSRFITSSAPKQNDWLRKH